MADDQVDLDKQLATSAEALEEAKQRVRSWPLHMRTYSALSSGPSKTYRRGRTVWSQAYHDPTPERFHAWRKQVKDHGYHVRLLQDIWPAVLQSYRHTLKELADLLGDDHDLVFEICPPIQCWRADTFGATEG